jgi:deoxyribodipyrimidine photo-lyase
MTAATIVWFRHDLRLADQPALHAAVLRRGPIVPVFVWSPEEEGDWPPGAASRWWLHHSLTALERELKAHGSPLIVRQGRAAEILPRLAREVGADAVHYCRRYEPAAIGLQRTVETALRKERIACASFNSALIHEPDAIRTQTGKSYRVFTPYSKTCFAQPAPEEPTGVPSRWNGLARSPASDSIEALELLPSLNWADEFPEYWTPGEAGADKALRRFLKHISDYAQERNRADHAGNSALSPHLHYGEIGPRQVWHAACHALNESPAHPRRAEPFLRELLWREFAHVQLFDSPESPDTPLRPEFEDFPWKDDRKSLRAWQRGETGYPWIDAGMRQLWRTGGMHNRVRMAVGSFLVKDLLIRWEKGAAWFWDTLVDADLANNTMNWQWVAGCGVDAAPFFRVFNPELQGQRFDPEEDYVRRWVPELARLPAKWIHRPWKAPAHVLEAAGVQLGGNYPEPIVDHDAARRRALDAFHGITARR